MCFCGLSNELEFLTGTSKNPRDFLSKNTILLLRSHLLLPYLIKWLHSSAFFFLNQFIWLSIYLWLLNDQKERSSRGKKEGPQVTVTRPRKGTPRLLEAELLWSCEAFCMLVGRVFTQLCGQTRDIWWDFRRFLCKRVKWKPCFSKMNLAKFGVG